MPSGDSMSGALFAAWLWDMASSHSASTSSSSAATSALMRATSFVVALAVMVERMSLSLIPLSHAFLIPQSLLLFLRLVRLKVCELWLAGIRSWGWHSLAQTSAGASLGVVLYFWSTRVPLYFALVETVITIPLSFFLLLADPARAGTSHLSLTATASVIVLRSLSLLVLVTCPSLSEQHFACIILNIVRMCQSGQYPELSCAAAT